MRIAERAIELPRLVLLATASICALGVAGILTSPKERTPRIKLPVIMVAVPNPGATPPTNENEIVNRVEEEVEGALDHLKESGAIRTQAVNGAAVMAFVFDEYIPVSEAKRDVESLINRVKGRFPLEAQQDPGPIVNDIAFEDFPIIQVIVAGGAGGRHRRDIADQLERQIEKVPGVAAVDTFGGLEREVQIELNPHLMTLYGFDYGEIATAIRRANVDAPSGSIESTTGSERRVRSDTKLPSLAAIGEVPLGVRDGKPIVLNDLANVHMGHEPLKSLARYDGQDAVVLLVRAKTDIDVLATVRTIELIVNDFAASMKRGWAGETDNNDAGIRVGTVRSQAREIGYMINQLTTSAGYGLVLVMATLWISLGWRNASIISVAIPFAILGTAAIGWFTRQTITQDLTINNMTLFGMILVVGMVVDGCIIVGENIYRHRELGRYPVDAAKRGISEVGSSLLCAYLTTFAAFGPMFLLHGVMGQFMGQLPVVVLFALCSAMIVDHFLLPVLSVYLMKVPAHRQAAIARSAQTQRADMDPHEIEIANAKAVAQASRTKQVYGSMLGYALRHRLMVLALSVAVVATPIGLFMVGAIGLEFFPDTDVPIVEVYFELPLGSSMEHRTAHVAKRIEQAVLAAVRPGEWHQQPDGQRSRPVTTIGEPGALNTNLDNEQGAGPEFGMVYVELVLAGERERSASQIRHAIVQTMPPMPGVLVRVKSPSDGPPAGAPVLVRVMARKGTDATLNELAQRAWRVFELLKKIPGTFDVTNDYRLRPEFVVKPNRAVASLFDIDAQQIAQSVNFALEGVQVTEVNFGGTDPIDVRMRNQATHRDQLEDLTNLPLRSPTGKIVSLEQVAQIDRVRSANVIRHYEQQRVINIRAQLDEGVLADDVKDALATALAGSEPRTLRRDQDVIWSDDRTVIEFGGENEERDTALEDLHIALLVAVAAMMIILTIKFNSFIQPLIILFSVPMSLVGVSIGLMICGFYFSISAMIGVVALSGIVVNDAIVLVDFVNRLRNAGVPMIEAVVYAGQLRLRPIFLTTVTTIGGLLPLSLNLAGGGEFFQPLTVTIMFGLGFATMLQLFIVPIACYTFDYRSKWFDFSEGEEKSDATQS